MGKKVFVGGLPDGVQDGLLRSTFSQYGQVEDVFVKPNCEPGRQWAFVTFATEDQAAHAKAMCDRQLTFPGGDRPCDVMVAKNQGMYGQNPGTSATPDHRTLTPATPAVAADGPKKVFVGSLPDDITEEQLRAEFCKYGAITDVFVKPGCESGRQWAFVTFCTPTEAHQAKASTDRVLMFPGSLRACEVTLARNQGMFGHDPVHTPQHASYEPPNPSSSVPRKIFVGSLPDDITETTLRAEFSRYGQLQDVFIKTNCESGRQWAFLTFATPEQAALAKEHTDRVLQLPGASRPCEVMLARNQGKFGQEPLAGVGTSAPVAAVAARPAGVYTVYAQPGVPAVAAPPAPVAGQPPPPTAPPPPHLTTWRCYYTVAGLPYYHNSATGVTQWECPPELQVPAAPPAPAPAYAAAPVFAAQPRYAPY